MKKIFTISLLVVAMNVSASMDDDPTNVNNCQDNPNRDLCEEKNARVGAACVTCNTGAKGKCIQKSPGIINCRAN